MVPAKAGDHVLVVSVGEVGHPAGQCVRRQLPVQVTDPRAHGLKVAPFGRYTDQVDEELRVTMGEGTVGGRHASHRAAHVLDV